VKKHLIIGASIAGLSAIEVLRQNDKESEIVLISEEKDIYSKCIMHLYMAGERSEEMLKFIEPDFMKKNKVKWKKGEKVISIDPAKKQVILSDQAVEKYDNLLIAIGSHSAVPPIEGLKDAKNACAFHSLDDCKKVLELSEKAEDIVILGAGLVGVDAAFGLTSIGKSVTMVDMKEHMLSMQLDEKAAKVYADKFVKRGVSQYYNVGVNKVEKNDNGLIEKIVLSDGRKLLCDLLIVATGVKANVECLHGSGLEVDRSGLVIDENCKTNIEDIYGAGDVTGLCLIWPVAAKEGRTAAINMTGGKAKMNDFFFSKATINIFDIPTMSFGIHEAPDDTYKVEVKEGKDGSYQKLIYKNGKIFGAIIQKDMKYTGILNQLKYKDLNLADTDKNLLDFDYADLLVI